MVFSIVIDQPFCLKYGLNKSEGILYSYYLKCPSWSDKLTIQGSVWYFCSRNKVVEDLPLLSDKKKTKADTVYRLTKSLSMKGLINWKRFEGKDLINFKNTPSSEWNRLGKFSDHSENFPTKLGKFSENGSENFPTYYSIKKDYSISNKDISQIWSKWIDFKKEEFGFEYKSPKTENIAKSRLVKLAGGDLSKIEEIVDNAISNKWKGFYPIKKETKEVKLDDFKSDYGKGQSWD